MSSRAVDGTVYVMLTNNTRRKPDQVDAANPRPESSFGHIIEIKETGGDHAATSGTWDFVVKCGDPNGRGGRRAMEPRDLRRTAGSVRRTTAPSTPTGGCGSRPTRARAGVRPASPTASMRWKPKATFAATRNCSSAAPSAVNCAGPISPDNSETLFLAVQHPGTDGTKDFKGFERNSTFEDPATRWPDFDPAMPPRPSVVVVTKKGGGKIAS